MTIKMNAAKKICIFIGALLLIGSVLLVSNWQNNRVARLTIIKPENEIRLKGGYFIQLEVEGYTKDGTPIPPEKLEKMKLTWSANSDAVSVDENGVVRVRWTSGRQAVNISVGARNGVQARPIVIWVDNSFAFDAVVDKIIVDGSTYYLTVTKASGEQCRAPIGSKTPVMWADGKMADAADITVGQVVRIVADNQIPLINMPDLLCYEVILQ